MKRTAIGLAILALLSTSAAPVVAQPASAPAAETTPSPRKLELARQLVQLSDLNANMKGVIRNMLSQIAAQGGANLSAERQARMKVMEEAETNAFDKMIPHLVEAMVQGYAREFSEKELSDILAFYQSPSGRQMLAKTPQLTQGLAVEMARMIPQMRRDMGEEICAKVTCTTAEKAAYFGSSAPNADKPTPPAGP